MTGSSYHPSQTEQDCPAPGRLSALLAKHGSDPLGGGPTRRCRGRVVPLHASLHAPDLGRGRGQRRGFGPPGLVSPPKTPDELPLPCMRTRTPTAGARLASLPVDDSATVDSVKGNTPDSRHVKACGWGPGRGPWLSACTVSRSDPLRTSRNPLWPKDPRLKLGRARRRHIGICPHGWSGTPEAYRDMPTWLVEHAGGISGYAHMAGRARRRHIGICPHGWSSTPEAYRAMPTWLVARILPNSWSSIHLRVQRNVRPVHTSPAGGLAPHQTAGALVPSRPPGPWTLPSRLPGSRARRPRCPLASCALRLDQFHPTRARVGPGQPGRHGPSRPCRAHEVQPRTGAGASWRRRPAPLPTACPASLAYSGGLLVDSSRRPPPRPAPPIPIQPVSHEERNLAGSHPKPQPSPRCSCNCPPRSSARPPPRPSNTRASRVSLQPTTPLVGQAPDARR